MVVVVVVVVVLLLLFLLPHCPMYYETWPASGYHIHACYTDSEIYDSL